MNYNKELPDYDSMVIPIGGNGSGLHVTTESLIVDGEFEEFFAKNGYAETIRLFNRRLGKYSDPFPIDYVIDYKKNIDDLCERIQKTTIDENMIKELAFEEDFFKYDHIGYICSYDDDFSSLSILKKETYEEMFSMMRSKMISYSPTHMNTVTDDYSICFNTSVKQDILSLKLALDGNNGIKVENLDFTSIKDKITLLLHYGILL